MFQIVYLFVVRYVTYTFAQDWELHLSSSDARVSTSAVRLDAENMAVTGSWGSTGRKPSMYSQTRVEYPGATLGGQAGHYSTPAVKGMS